MISHAWSVLCEKSIVDKDTNNITMSVIEQLTLPTQPSAPPDRIPAIAMPISVVSLWYRGTANLPAIASGRITFLAPDNTPHLAQTFEINLKDHERARSRITLPLIPFKGRGRYFVIVEISNDTTTWHEAARIPFSLEIQENAPALSH